MILNYKKTKNKNIKNSQKPNLLLDKKDFIKNTEVLEMELNYKKVYIIQNINIK